MGHFRNDIRPCIRGHTWARLAVGTPPEPQRQQGYNDIACAICYNDVRLETLRALLTASCVNFNVTVLS